MRRVQAIQCSSHRTVDALMTMSMVMLTRNHLGFPKAGSFLREGARSAGPVSLGGWWPRLAFMLSRQKYHGLSPETVQAGLCRRQPKSREHPSGSIS